MKKTTAEMKIKISNARDCVLVEASKLSLTDTFMKHKPRTVKEKVFKDTLTKVIKDGIEDFYRPAMDPSFVDESKTKIHYKAGEEPAVGKSYNWWEETVKNSELCLGTKAQYVAFLGVLIKKLVAKGWTVDQAWYAVCNNSKELGHYIDSNNLKNRLENTGSRKICGFCDLSNTFKILAKDEGAGGYWLAGGGFRHYGYSFPLATSVLYRGYFFNHNDGVAWLVRKKEI